MECKKEKRIEDFIGNFGTSFQVAADDRKEKIMSAYESISCRRNQTASQNGKKLTLCK